MLFHLSRQFGVRLTQADNIPLYHASSGWLGVKYRYGGNTKNGVDCSGLVCNIYRQVYGVALERNSVNMLRRNCVTVRKNNLREGDLVFFRSLGSGKSRTPTHVGIYLKNGKFIHSSSSRGVIVSNLSENYYVRTWITGGRVKR
jgi:lipoprotein Spr